MKRKLLLTLAYILVAKFFFGQWSVDSLVNICANDAVSTFGTKAMLVNASAWELYDVTTFSSNTGNLSLGRNAIKVASVNNIAYFGGGQYGPFTDPVYTKNIDVYNFTTNQWTLQKLSKAREVGAAASVRNKILFAGGRDALNMYNTVDIFDVSSGVRTIAKLSKARTDIAVAVNGNKVVFAGGWYFDFSYNRPASNAVDIYDVSTGAWTTAKLSQKRQSISVASVGSKIVFAGGLPNSGTTDRVDIYDVLTNTWSVASLSSPRYGMTVNVIGNKAYFASGMGASNKIDVYNATTNSWSVINMPYNLANAAGAVVNGQLFYAGGYDATTYAVSDVLQMYDPATNIWTTGTISQARAGSNVISINNITLFAGGFTKVTYPATGSTRIDIYTLPAIAAMKINALEFSVFPNPVVNEIQFSAGKKTQLPVVLNLYNDKGNIVATYKATSLNAKFSLANILPGKYILSARDAGGSYSSKKIIKQ